VTAVGETAVTAEVLAKRLFLAGAHAATAEAETEGIPAVLVTANGRTILTGGLA
jgi:thiamine biosynthesis lipoprotein ApbE